MNDKQIKAFVRTGEKTRKTVGDGLYIRVQTKGIAYWEVRYTINGKRRFMTLDGGQYPAMPLVDAKAEAAQIKKLARTGTDPLAERQRLDDISIQTVDDLFEDWYLDLAKRLKHPKIPKRIYTKEIKPSIGGLAVGNVNARDIRAIIHKVAQSDRPAIANDTLMYAKQLFNHACKLDLVNANPASAFNVADAGGAEQSRTRALNIKELKITFQTFRDNSNIFTRDNYLAVALLVSLGVRKGELIAAQWHEFNFEKNIWYMPSVRSKKGPGIKIPLPDATISWLKELHVRACGSDYVFPARRASKRRGYISDDTLNHALAKMFGQKVDSKKQPYDNLLGKVGIEYFTVHDLRRTCRSLLAENKTPSHIAERCLNHKLKGVEGVYDRYDYLSERREALTNISCLIAPLVDNLSNVTPFSKLA